MTVQPTEATAPATGLASIQIDEVEILRKLRLTPEAILVCQRYGLDPVRKHVVLVDGNVYVTRDGLLTLAHRSGQFDGMDVATAVLDEGAKEWRSTASVFRKDMGRPFTFSGRYPTGRKNSPEMAEKVAVARALRHAFDVSIPTEDEQHLGEERPQRTGDLGAALKARQQEPAEQGWPAVKQPPVEAPVEAELVLDVETGEVQA